MTDKTELDLLKERADQMGIKYHPNIGVDSLRDKVNAVIAGEVSDEAEPVQKAKAAQTRAQAYEEAMKLIRIRLTCMDPAKSDWPAEIITISNDVVGDVKVAVPYKEEFYENGYHVPNIIYQFLKERKYSAIKVTKGPKGPVQTSIQANAYAIEVLPQLTPEELEDLRLQQAASKSID